MSTSRSMGRTASSVGMMEGAFFVSRTELLEWVNQLLQVSLTKVEQCASGAIYCQIVDACYPGSVKMAKVNWMARADHEFIPNYKILQAAFDRNTIQKHVDVDKLIRAKYQDNLEFLQWMKAMWDREGAGRRDYEPVKARDGRPLPAWAKAPSATGGAVRADAVEKENLSTNRNPRNNTDAQKFDPSTRRAAPGGGAKAPAPKSLTPKATGGAKAAAHAELEVEALKQQLSEHSEEMEDLRETNGGLEKERDYYFRKLRKVEILCETLKAKMNPDLDINGFIGEIQGILYEEMHSDEEDPDCLVDAVEPPQARAAAELPRGGVESADAAADGVAVA